MQRVGVERCSRSATHQRGFAQAAGGGRNRDLWRRCCLSCPLPAAVEFGPLI